MTEALYAHMNNKIKKKKVNVRERKLYILLIGMKISATTIESSMEVSQLKREQP
jgi:hypothetical protein